MIGYWYFLNGLVRKRDFIGKQPTNQEVIMRAAHIFRIEDGIIVEQWEIADQLELLRHAEVISFN
jgi:predicted SnoaL-like aldol condensation-catalyzing enzyme